MPFFVLIPLTVALVWVIVVLLGIPLVGLTAFIITNGKLIAILLAIIFAYKIIKK